MQITISNTTYKIEFEVEAPNTPPTFQITHLNLLFHIHNLNNFTIIESLGEAYNSLPFSISPSPKNQNHLLTLLTTLYTD